MKPDGKISQQLIENCEKLGLIHKGGGKFATSEKVGVIFYEFDLSASGYEFEHIAKNIISQL